MKLISLHNPNPAGISGTFAAVQQLAFTLLFSRGQVVLCGAQGVSSLFYDTKDCQCERRHC